MDSVNQTRRNALRFGTGGLLAGVVAGCDEPVGPTDVRIVDIRAGDNVEITEVGPSSGDRWPAHLMVLVHPGHETGNPGHVAIGIRAGAPAGTRLTGVLVPAGEFAPSVSIAWAGAVHDGSSVPWTGMSYALRSTQGFDTIKGNGGHIFQGAEVGIFKGFSCLCLPGDPDDGNDLDAHGNWWSWAPGSPPRRPDETFVNVSNAPYLRSVLVEGPGPNEVPLERVVNVLDEAIGKLLRAADAG